MAVGKESMERAAKAAPAKKTAGGASDQKTTGRAAKVKTAKPVAAAKTVAAPGKEVLNQIVYQTSSGMLSRDAEPNERFGLGDAMPVYYF